LSASAQLLDAATPLLRYTSALAETVIGSSAVKVVESYFQYESRGLSISHRPQPQFDRADLTDKNNFGPMRRITCDLRISP
jgi:hypothetical protein